MNTMGKTLVIINFLFALLFLAFVATVAVTGTNWKRYSDDLERELKVSRENTDILAGTKASLTNQLAFAEKKLKDVEEKYARDKKKAADDLAAAKEDGKKMLAQLEDKLVKGLMAGGELERIHAENNALTALIGQRDIKIVQLTEQVSKAEEKAQQMYNEARSHEERVGSLLERVRELERAKAQSQVVSAGSSPVAKDPNQPNPPPAYVKGVIEKIDPNDRTLVQISVGTDAGVGVNHTLEAYRLSPKADYLGMIRILDANAHKSVGRLMRGTTRATGAATELRVGDEVASEIRAR
jgi:hypothetical protein